MLDGQCWHGIKWADKCRECDLIAAREVVNRWGAYVDESRMVIEAAESAKEKEEVKA